jgi:hypothetical protein
MWSEAFFFDVAGHSRRGYERQQPRPPRSLLNRLHWTADNSLPEKDVKVQKIGAFAAAANLFIALLARA